MEHKKTYEFTSERLGFREWTEEDINIVFGNNNT